MSSSPLPEDSASDLMLSELITQMIAGGESVDEVVREALTALCRHRGWDFGAGFFLDANQELVNRVIWRTQSPELDDFEAVTKNSKFLAERGLPGRVLASGGAAWIKDVADDRNFPRAPAALKAGLHSAVAFPVRGGGRVLGVLELFSREITPEDKSLLDLGERIGAEIGQFVLLKKVEARLRDSEAIRRDLIESAIDAVIQIDSLGLVREWNSTAEQIFGWSHAEVTGRRLSQLIIPQRYRDAHETGLKRFMVTGQGPVVGARIEIEALRKDGNELPVELAISALSLNDEVTFTASVRDISERKAQERRREDFLAFASHELRSPLTSVYGAARILSRQFHSGQIDEASTREMVEVIASESERMVGIVDVFLDLTQIQSGKIDISLSNVNLVALLDEELKSSLGRHPEADLRLECSQATIAAWTDSSRLQQVFSNLIENAIKYSGPSPRVTVTLREDNDSALLFVSDNGPGIPIEDQPYIFQRYYRGVQTAQRSSKGLGIGLFLVYQLITRLGGSITFDSGPEGTRFSITLPVEGPFEERP